MLLFSPMKTKPAIYGVIPVLHMPYREDDSIDYDVLAAEVDFVLAAGADVQNLV